MENPFDDPNLLHRLLDSLKDPFVFVDCEHIIRYMNRAAQAHYERGATLLGTNLLDCHDAESGRTVLAVFERLKAGQEEELITNNAKHRIFMRAVRDAQGELSGYYERYEPPRRG